MTPLLDSIHGISEKVTSVLGTLSEQAGSETQDLRKNPELLQTIEELIDVNHHLLNAIGVGHASLDEVCKITAEFKLHSKLTGAGGGGCALTFINPSSRLFLLFHLCHTLLNFFGLLFLIAIPSEHLQQVITKLEAKGFQCFQTSIGVGGVCLHETFGTGVESASLTADVFSQKPVRFHLNSKKRSHEDVAD